MNTKLLMSASAVVMGITGITLSFFPLNCDGILAWWTDPSSCAYHEICRHQQRHTLSLIFSLSLTHFFSHLFFSSLSVIHSCLSYSYPLVTLIYFSLSPPGHCQTRSIKRASKINHSPLAGTALYCPPRCTWNGQCKK